MSVVKSLRAPIIAAPMAGGPSTPALVNAIAEEGGLGFLAGGLLKASKLRAEMAQMTGIYGVNLFYPQQMKPNKEHLYSIHEQLCEACDSHNLPHPFMVPRADLTFDFEEKFQAVLEFAPAVLSSSFGSLSPAQIEQCHDADIEVWVSVTNVDEARAAEIIGADVLIVQGHDAGGHRLTWDPTEVPNQTDTYQLALEVSAATSTKIVTSGGIRTPEDVKKFLGIKRVKAVATGSMFLKAKEAGTSKFNRKLISSTLPTTVTRAYTGRYARGIETWWTKTQQEIPFSYPLLSQMFASVDDIRNTEEFAYCLVGDRRETIKRKKVKKIMRFLLGN